MSAGTKEGHRRWIHRHGNRYRRTLLRILIGAGYVPVIAPLALGPENEPLNIDGDRTAAHVAAALQADVLLLITDVGGVSLRTGSYVT